MGNSSIGNRAGSGGWSGESGGYSSDAANTTQPFRTGESSSRSAIGSGGGGNAENLVEQAQQTAGDIASGVQEKAGEVVSQVREQAVTRISSQKDQATGTLYAVAHAIRNTGQNLREQDQTQIADYTDKIADQIEQLTSYLGHRDLNQISTDLQRYARRQPAIFLGGALALGFLGARFLKSSSQPAQQSSGSQSRNFSGDNSNQYSGGTPGDYAGSDGGSYSGNYGSYSLGEQAGYAGGAAALGATYSDVGSDSTGYGYGSSGSIGSASTELGSDMPTNSGQGLGSDSSIYSAGAYDDTSGINGGGVIGSDNEEGTSDQQSNVTPYLGPSEA